MKKFSILKSVKPLKRVKFANNHFRKNSMKFSAIIYLFLLGSLFTISIIAGSGCAQIGAPTGGAKDTIPPHLVYAKPLSGTTGFTDKKITLTFDEYIDVKDIQNNVLVAPYPKTNPVISFKLKTVTVSLKDTLQPNTTYSINFGNAIRDNNEGNPLKDFTYIFSTGDTIDSLELSGNVTPAETGIPDSTYIVMLYRNAVDSTVEHRKPDYLAKPDGKGNFTFSNLPEADFKIYALKDGDGSKTYNSVIEGFAFLDHDITVSEKTAPVTLLAYAEEKDKKSKKGNTKVTQPKKLKYNTAVSNSSQDLLTELQIEFTHTLKDFDPEKIVLTDTLFNPLKSIITIDSIRKNVFIKNAWKENEQYYLLISKDAVSDSANEQLSKTDSIRFKTRSFADYGSLVLNFSNVDVSKHPVLQFVQADEVIRSAPITGASWTEKLFPPGEYNLRILYDENNNGKWDPGSYSKKQQPEKAIPLEKKLAIKANWENERDIVL